MIETTGPPSESVPGLDLKRLGAWLASQVEGAGSNLTGQLICGGQSNLTYAVSDGRTSWILRRPPIGHVLATAHDMSREYRVMRALRGTAVPVPETYAQCLDDSVVGAPFYIMERVAGTPYRRAGELVPLGPDRTRALSHHFVTVLARLHDVDPAAVGLADFGRPEGFLSRQVSRWNKQLDASYCRDLPTADELHRRLQASVASVEAAATTPSIVHGDYRLDNVLVEEENGLDRIRAVVDWEMATLGDPLTDLAVLVLYQRMAEWGIGAATNDACLAPGWLSETELMAAYEKESPRDLAHFDFYLGLAAYKLAAIGEGIQYRHMLARTAEVELGSLAHSIDTLLDAGLAALDP
jgi:aminoglycoside phosphotransferase (APT) family kinase protein